MKRLRLSLDETSLYHLTKISLLKNNWGTMQTLRLGQWQRDKGWSSKHQKLSQQPILANLRSMNMEKFKKTHISYLSMNYSLEFCVISCIFIWAISFVEYGLVYFHNLGKWTSWFVINR